MVHTIIYCFNQYTDILKWLLIQNIFQNGNLGNYDESMKPSSTSDNSFSPLINYFGNKIRLKFSGGCLKQQNKLTYTHGTIVNIYAVYELGASGSFNDDLTLKNSMFGAVKLTENADLIFRLWNWIS